MCDAPAAQGLCDRCERHYRKILADGAQLRLTPEEAFTYVATMDASTAANITVAFLMKSIRSFGIEEARKLADEMLTHAAEDLSAMARYGYEVDA